MRKGFQWPIFVVALLGVTVVVNTVMLMIALSDPSFAIEENYYQKAVDWDKKREQLAINKKLGWSLQMETVSKSAHDKTLIRVKLVDKNNKPITGAQIKAVYFHNARASVKSKLEFIAQKPNTDGYLAQTYLRSSGLWIFRCEVKAGKSFFTETIRHRVFFPKKLAKQSTPRVKSRVN